MKATTAQRHRQSFTVLLGLKKSELEHNADEDPKVRFDRRGLHSVHANGTFKTRIFGLPKLSAHDVMRVNHATIREGMSHRIWPPHVLRQFNQAQVITKTSIKHYELKDVNLNRVDL
jgi:hypothetical protein